MAVAEEDMGQLTVMAFTPRGTACEQQLFLLAAAEEDMGQGTVMAFTPRGTACGSHFYWQLLKRT